MKFRMKSFSTKLWIYFAVFAGVIFAALWLLQIVFLQNFYDGMAEKNVRKAADQIAEEFAEFQESRLVNSADSSIHQDNSQTNDDFSLVLDHFARDYSLLVFLVNDQGDILYGTDEHSTIYRGIEAADASLPDSGSENQNPYHSSDEKLSWQTAAEQYLNLPQEYHTLLQMLEKEPSGETSYRINDNTAYVYGRRLKTPEGSVILYISASLEAIGGTVSILRVQLIWITVMSLLLAFVMASFISGKFSRPVSVLSSQARNMADGNYEVHFEKGFCRELDDLADTLDTTAGRLAQTENFRREFLANISHDLRTPLTMIRGYAEMVRDLSGDDKIQREQDLSVIIREADRLSALVNEILDYTSLQSGQASEEFSSIDLSQIVSEVTAQFASLCEAEGFLIETRITPQLFVTGNRQQLSRVLYNLIDNGLSHCGQNKRLIISAAIHKENVRVEVQDFGEGISPEDLPYIWERYFTLKQRRRNARGSGLGLAISREILLAHHAQFGAESREGEGSTFWFELDRS